MTTVTFTTKGQRIQAVEFKGHAGLADQGQDVLCAALSAVIELLEVTVNDVLAVGAATKVRQDGASVSLKLPGDMGQEAEDACQALMAGLMLYLTDLSEKYPENLTVLDMEV